MKSFLFGTLLFCQILIGAPAIAHFAMVIPSDNMIMPHENRLVNLSLSFSHPFEMIEMDMEKPKRFSVLANGEHQDLMDAITMTKHAPNRAWQVAYPVKRPGVYIFFLEPTPYWERSEDLFIIHYTKTVVAAFGVDTDWDREIGLKTEIVPLSRPFGLYAGNIFQGIVKVDKTAVPFAQVEIEFYNEGKNIEAPTNFMITQTVKADPNGIFTYSPPWGGWWGFAALNTADFTLKHQGIEKEVEIGAVLWVNFEGWKEKK